VRARPVVLDRARALLVAALLSSLAAAPPVLACDSGAASIFACEAANGRKFIELCAVLPSAGDDGYLEYRFGSQDANGDISKVELTFPADRRGSYKRFFGSLYTDKGVYTQSVRFTSGDFSYRVFTEARGNRELGAGVDVRNLRTGKTTTVACSERPRFYIYDLKALLACDPDTPVGRACIK
jgi:hypothetical protein